MVPAGLLPTTHFHPSFQWMKPLQEFYNQKKDILKKYQSESGEFETATYNVAGLPEIISASHPSKNMSLIAEKLSQFSLVFTQEDFWYHKILGDNLSLPFKLPPFNSSGLGDGLSQFSDKPLIPIMHVTWNACYGVLENGSDCLTPKGFSFSQMELVPGLLVHTYNVHMDSGDSLGDQKTRVEQFQQLLQFIQSHSKDVPILVAGDFNLNFSIPSAVDLAAFQNFLQQSGMIDSCEQLQCGDQRLDHILSRGSPQLKLSVVSWMIPHDFFTEDGHALSDHDPVLVRFHYEKLGEPLIPQIFHSFKMPKLNGLNRQPHTALQDEQEP